jgi:SAM-dependent methyltransferase
MVKPTDQLNIFDIIKNPYFYNQLIQSSSCRFLPKFISLLQHDSKILDVGSGPSTIVPPGYNVTRCDVNPEYEPDVICSALKLDFECERFDGVVHSWVLEHLEEPRQALEECYRVLKPHGLLYLTTNMSWHLHEEPRDFYRFTEHGIKYLFDNSQWEIVFIKPTLGFWGTVTQLIAYKIVALLKLLKLDLIHPLLTIPLQLFGLICERKLYDTSLCAGYCAIARKH